MNTIFRKYFFLIFLFIICFANCQNNNKQSQKLINEFQIYINEYTVLNVDSTLKHFPNIKDIKSNRNNSLAIISGFFGVFSNGFVYTNKIKIEEIENIKNNFCFIDSIDYFNDTIFRIKSDYYNRNPKLNINITELSFPYPTFYFGLLDVGDTSNCFKYFDEMHNSNFPKYNVNTIVPNDLKLYLIDSKNGVFLKSKTNLNYYSTLNEWEHGYSKGIAISLQYQLISYWFMIW